jgi:hypothetical protein
MAQPLSADGVAQMIQNILKRTLGADDRPHTDQIGQLCGGHPQAIERSR